MARLVKSFSIPEELFEQIETEAAKNNQSQSSIASRALSDYFQRQRQRSSWETISDDGWYDPKRFYTYGQDKKGHSVTVRTNIPKNLIGELKRLVESGKVPEYRAISDMVRDAIYHRVKTISQWIEDGDLSDEVDLHMLVSEELALQQQKHDMASLVSALRENLEDAYQRQDFAWLSSYIKERTGKANSVPESYRESYMRVLDEYRDRVAQWTPEKRKLRPA